VAPKKSMEIRRSDSTLTHVDIIEELPMVLKPVQEGLVADAAVALLLRMVNEELEVFLVKRVESPSDPWSGNVALPGGKRTPEDRDLKQTVVRETLEETNINLLYRCRFLGVLETLISTPRPEMKILPFVVLVEHEPTVRLNYELDSFAWISLRRLIRNRTKVKFSFGERDAYVFDDVIVWGLTYRVLEMFVNILSSLHAQV